MSFAISAHAQAFSLRDTPFVAKIATPPASSGNDPVFDTLTHYWALGEASGNARADSKGSIALNETGGAVNSATGKHGNAADFQPVSQAGHRLTSAAAISDSAPLTLAFWVYVRSLPAVAASFSLIRSGDVTFDSYIDPSGNILVNIGDAGDQSSAALGSLNAWHLVVAVSTGSNGDQQLSVDGSTFGGPDVAGGSSAPATFQVGGPPTPLVLDGLVDELMIFSSPLTQSQVTTLWNSGAGTFYTP